MTAVLPFRLKLAGTDRFHGLHAVSTSFRVHGLLFLEHDVLTVQWGGAVRIQDVGPLSARDDREVLPVEGITVAVSSLYRARLVGGWWRPRLTLQESEFGALAMVPGEAHGTVQFWYARGDRAVAHAMAAAINGAIESVSTPANDPRTGSFIDESVRRLPTGLTDA